MTILGASLDELRATRTSRKWRVYDPDVVPVWVAEMDAAPCPEVVEAVTSALRRGDTGYAHPDAYAEAFAGFAGDRWGWSPAPRTMLAVADVMIGVEQVLRSAVPREGAVVLSPPCYDAFHGFVALTGRRAVTARLDEDQRLDPEALERAFAAAGPGSAYLLCNPQNPTGTVHTRAELTRLAELAAAYRILVVSDEIHAPLVQPGVDFVPYLDVPGGERGVAVVSGSKAWNLAGLKAALLVPGTECPVVADLHPVVTHGPNHLGVLAGTTAYTDGREWLDRLLVELAERRTLLESLLAERVPGVRAVPAQATYLAWLDCRELAAEHQIAHVQRHFLEHGRVALGAGPGYDPERGDRWARFNLATSADVLTTAVERMAASLTR